MLFLFIIMKKYKLNEKDLKLIEIAKNLIKKRYTRNEIFQTSVGCALETNKNNVYLGVNIHSLTSTPTSIDAEQNAMGNMVTNGERTIKTIVAIHNPKNKNLVIFQPCGVCRHIMSQFGNPFIIINSKYKVKLSDLYPLPVK